MDECPWRKAVGGSSWRIYLEWSWRDCNIRSSSMLQSPCEHLPYCLVKNKKNKWSHFLLLKRRHTECDGHTKRDLHRVGFSGSLFVLGVNVSRQHLPLLLIRKRVSVVVLFDSAPLMGQALHSAGWRPCISGNCSRTAQEKRSSDSLMCLRKWSQSHPWALQWCCR